MADTPDEELGPIDYLVVEFPAGEQRFTGAMAAELADLAESGIIRILDLLVLVKDADGSVEAYEIEDLGDLGALQALEGQLAELLALEDVEDLAAAMEPGSAAGVLVWENSWAAPFAIAARESGGQLIASGRIPTQALIAAFESDNEEGS
ncbi:MAG TPA: DUF6325 family protein [Microthrixaceae bacterium]|nr:DUF6325 family protein [Microthrixaceae bacterium]